MEIEKIGRRYYIRGSSYSIRGQLKSAGCKWDPDQRSWWTGKKDVADRFATVDAPTSQNSKQKETVGETERVLGGRGTYKGKSYYLIGREWNGDVEFVTSRTDKYKLCARDGSFVFWAPTQMVGNVHSYKRLTSIRSLREYAERRKREYATGECECWCHNEPNAGRPGSILYDGCDRCGCEAC